jgi:beta-1,2-mannobiose phosphorylase / 1,2-beta-oligomannan phosphorylase
MVSVKKEGVILRRTTLSFEDEAVLNPATFQEGNTIHMFYRAVRKGNHSTVGYCKLEGPLKVVERRDSFLIGPQFDYEVQGVEDPRIVKIDDLFYLTFAAYDGMNALGGLATSKDMVEFERQGLIVPLITFEHFRKLAEYSMTLNEKYTRFHSYSHHLATAEKVVLLWDKNVVFFPRRINNKLVFLHRIKPDIQLVCIDNLSDLTPAFWENYFQHFSDNIVICPKFDHEISYLGGGCPPIETPDGWLMIYHGVHDSINGYVYCACAALLDLENPQKEIARLPYPLFKPELDWEVKGDVNNVVFPTGTALFDDTLYIYYGAADTRIACASMSLNELLKELKTYLPN